MINQTGFWISHIALQALMVALSRQGGADAVQPLERPLATQSGVDEKAGLAGPDKRGITGTAGSENRDLDDSVLLGPCIQDTATAIHKTGKWCWASGIRACDSMARDEDH